MSNFWSKRRAAVAAEAEAEVQTALAAEREEAVAEKTDEDILEELGLPDPDALTVEDDFSVFLKEVVPARIRTRALRRLWRLNPVLANVDGLVDYGEDFTDAAMVVEKLQTTYQVGKGMLAHVQELARQVEEAEGAPLTVEDVEEEALSFDEEVPAEETGAEEEFAQQADEAVQAAEAEEDMADLAPAPTRHRMQFRFEEHQTG